MTKSWRKAFLDASMISSMLMLRALSPYWMFSAMLQSNSTGSWDTMPIWDLRKGTFTVWDERPSINWKQKITSFRNEGFGKRLNSFCDWREHLWVYAPLGLHQGHRTFPTAEHWCFSHSRCSQRTPRSDQTSQTQPGHLTPGYPAELDRWICSWGTWCHLWSYPKVG